MPRSSAVQKKPAPTHHKPVKNRVDALASLSCDDDRLFTTSEVAEITKMSTMFYDIGRQKGYGPPFVKIGDRVRYRRDALVAWLNSLTINPCDR